MLYKVMLTFELMDKIVKYYHSTTAFVQYFDMCFAAQGSSNF